MNKEPDLLTTINLDDLISSFGWQNYPLLASLLRTLFRKPARNFSNIMKGFDSAVAEQGLVEASRLTLKHFVCELRIFGLDRIPDSAFLALSNHPGMSDTLSLFCALNRPDLKIIALDRPFLNALPNTSKQLFSIKEDPASRIGLVRQVANHLRAGGAALTFPAGSIEPDLAVYPGALESLRSWTDSAGVFIRMAPETAILPVFVRGVIYNKAAKHWLLKIKKTREEKEKLAAALQLLTHLVFKNNDIHVNIQVGQPITAKQLGTTDSQVIHKSVITEMKILIENSPHTDNEGVSFLIA